MSNKEFNNSYKYTSCLYKEYIQNKNPAYEAAEQQQKKKQFFKKSINLGVKHPWDVARIYIYIRWLQ